MGKKKSRIELIDLAKAITIFLVFLGHTTGNLDTPLYRRVLYSFHMPLFFFLAGLSIKPVPLTGWDSWHKFLQKNALALIVPYLIWGLIYAPFSFDILAGSIESADQEGEIAFNQHDDDVIGGFCGEIDPVEFAVGHEKDLPDVVDG